MFDVEQIRATADRVAASHGLDVVEIEFQGGAKHRLLRIFIEKNEAERKKLDPTQAKDGLEWGTYGDRLAGVTHEDCEAFSRDFGTVLDVEDLIPGAEYTLEVSSPGLDRKLHRIEDYRRFQGMLVKIQTFEPVAGNRHWQGRLRGVSEGSIGLELEKKGSKKGAGHRAQSSENSAVEIALKNIEKAHLVPEI